MSSTVKKAPASRPTPVPAEDWPAAERPRSSLVPDDLEELAPGGVQSIGRAFAILEEVARNRDGIGLSDLCRRVGLHSSTTFHLIRTMVSLGYVRQLKDSKRYRVGRPIFMLAAQSMDEIEMVSVATPFLEDISAAMDESAILGVRLNTNLAILARTSGAGPFQVTDQVGMVRPLHATAAGKILLAGLSVEQFDIYLRRAELQAVTPRSITRADRLRAEILEVRRSGIAAEDGEFWPEVHSVSVGVYDFTARLVGAIALSGPAWKMDAARIQERIRLLRDTADKISLQFGYDARDHRGC
jgi:IclR family KDG regulon transcriptional repressor